MAYEQRDNSGSIFKNQKKEKDTHPDYTGNGMIDGREYWFSAWIKTDRNGNRFMSMAFKPKEEQQPREQRTAPADDRKRRPDPISTGRFNDDMQDDIPF